MDFGAIRVEGLTKVQDLNETAKFRMDNLKVSLELSIREREG